MIASRQIARRLACALEPTVGDRSRRGRAKRMRSTRHRVLSPKCGVPREASYSEDGAVRTGWKKWVAIESACTFVTADRGFERYRPELTVELVASE